MFSVPIVIFTFKRTKNLSVFESILSKITPSKIYFFSDGWRNEDEKEQVIHCRETIKQLNIPKETKVEYVFRKTNYGCFKQIAGGAMEVFDKEEKAIFLEDDNIPDLSFFDYCEKALDFYKDNERVFMIWGSNYLIKTRTSFSGTFTRHFLPCGWASWGWKFKKYYHMDFHNYLTKDNLLVAERNYCFKEMFLHDKTLWDAEIKNFLEKDDYLSWDFQLCYYLRLYNLVGLLPKYNLIINNGIDNNNTHGGGDLNNRMLRKLCPQKAYPISQLRFNGSVTINKRTEKRINQIRIPRYYTSVKKKILRKISGIIRSKNG